MKTNFLIFGFVVLVLQTAVHCGYLARVSCSSPKIVELREYNCNWDTSAYGFIKAEQTDSNLLAISNCGRDSSCSTGCNVIELIQLNNCYYYNGPRYGSSIMYYSETPFDIGAEPIGIRNYIKTRVTGNGYLIYPSGECLGGVKFQCTSPTSYSSVRYAGSSCDYGMGSEYTRQSSQCSSSYYMYEDVCVQCNDF